MRILRFLAKSAVTAYGSYTKGQIIEVNDDFALHLIQNGLAEEVDAAQPARFNKAFTPTENPENKELKPGPLSQPEPDRGDASTTGASTPSGRGITSQSSPAGRAFSSQTSKPFAGKK